jgi:hypothetical protein
MMKALIKEALAIFFKYLLFAAGISLVLSGCGYRMGYGEISDRYRTVAVPFAINDATGAFTAELIHTLSASGAFVYQPCNPDLVLKVIILEYYDENIGFRYDRNKQGDIKKTLVPSETRRFVKVEVTLIDPRNACAVLGPDILSASVDFDHEFNSSRDAVNVFSLGQVTDIDGAIDAAAKPLNARMAQKIIDYIANAW